MKMSNFENPTWRTAAILKIVIAPHLSRESSEYDEIWYADAKFVPIDGNVRKKGIPKFKMADGRHIENHFLLITRFNVRLIRNLQFRGIIVRTRKLGDGNVQFRKSNMAYDSNFEKSLYIRISAANRPNFDTAAETCKHKSEINIKRANITV